MLFQFTRLVYIDAIKPLLLLNLPDIEVFLNYDQ